MHGSKTSLCLLVLVASIVFIGCAPSKSSPRPKLATVVTPTPFFRLTPPTPSATPQDDDTLVASLRRDNTKLVPAIPWLADMQHILFNGDRRELVNHFEELQKAGVREILAKVEDVKGRELCALFVFSLPKTVPARKNVFDLHNHYLAKMAEMDDDIPSSQRRDTGQEHLVLSLD